MINPAPLCICGHGFANHETMAGVQVMCRSCPPGRGEWHSYTPREEPAPPSLESEVEGIVAAQLAYPECRPPCWAQDEQPVMCLPCGMRFQAKEAARSVARLVWARAIEEAAMAIEAERIKVLTTEEDPSWTEHFSELQRDIRALPGPFKE